jgi:UDP-GlcNAc:undecaprenyl-phosphate GlcNAc-1-phosphate transferase
MTTTLIGFTIAFFASLLITWLMQPVSRWVGAVDAPDRFRKVHQLPMPRLGGGGVFLGFLIPIALVVLCRPEIAVAVSLKQAHPRLVAMLLGAALIFLVGFVDDIRDLRPRYKFLGQLLASLLVYRYGFRIDCITLPMLGPVQLGVLTLPVTLFWFLGCINAINLMDGLDGLAGGIALFVCVSTIFVSLFFHHLAVLFLAACLSGAILGFLVHNFHPARIFLGDCGSMTLGFLIGGLALQGSHRTETSISLLIPIIAMGLPIFDTGVAILRRWSKRLPVSAADRGHIHHVLLRLGFSHRNTVLVLYATCIFLGIISLIVAVSDNEIAIIVLGGLALIFYVCVRILGGFSFEDIFNRIHHGLQRHKATAAARVAVEKTRHQLGSATSVDELWQICCECFEELSIDHACLKLNRSSNSEPLLLDWCLNKSHPHLCRDLVPESWAARFELRDQDRILGEFHILRHIDDRQQAHEVSALSADLRRAIVSSLAIITSAPRESSVER